MEGWGQGRPYWRWCFHHCSAKIERQPKDKDHEEDKDHDNDRMFRCAKNQSIMLINFFKDWKIGNWVSTGTLDHFQFVKHLDY